MYYIGLIPCDPNTLEHHGVKGMKWGVRRYQNEDGSLTPAGQKRYASSPEGLGYTPLKGKRGTGWQREVGRLQIKANKRAEKNQKKADKAEARGSSMEAQQYKEKAKFYTERGDFLREMQKTYASLDYKDRRLVDGARTVRNLAILFTGPIGIALGAAADIYATTTRVVNPMKARVAGG